MRGDRHVDDLSAVVGEDDEDEEQPECDRGHDEEVGGHDLARVIGEKRPPCLWRWARMPSHVFGKGGFTHRESQLQKLPVNARRAPQWVRRTHVTNQPADIGWDGRTASAMSAFPGPEQAKTTPMPCEDGRRLHDMERRAPATPSVRQPHPERTIKRRQAQAWTAGATRDDQLVPQRDDLQVQRRAWTNQNRSE